MWNVHAIYCRKNRFFLAHMIQESTVYFALRQLVSNLATERGKTSAQSGATPAAAGPTVGGPVVAKGRGYTPLPY
jgi:hypothetical protein